VLMDRRNSSSKRGNSPEPIQIESVNQIHTLMVLKDGFKDFKKEFSVQPGESQKINVRLEPLKAGMNELLTSSGKSPQGKQSAVTDPHKQLVENGVQNGMTIGYWTPTGISGFHKNSDEVPIPLERVAVNLIGIYSKYLKSDFEWESIGRVNTIFRITCDTPMPIATLKTLKRCYDPSTLWLPINRKRCVANIRISKSSGFHSLWKRRCHRCIL